VAPARRTGGVTLLELLVVLAIVGVLAGVAYPGYRQYLVRAHRMEAIEALLALAAAQERFHLQHGRYAEGFEPDVAPGLAVAPTTSGGRYRLRLAVPAPGHFVGSASPRRGSGQEGDDRCGTFWLDDAGRRGATDASGQDSTEQCWR
jgi:type IV pilus assembly protein PilE